MLSRDCLEKCWHADCSAKEHGSNRRGLGNIAGDRPLLERCLTCSGRSAFKTAPCLGCGSFQRSGDRNQRDASRRSSRASAGRASRMHAPVYGRAWGGDSPGPRHSSDWGRVRRVWHCRFRTFRATDFLGKKPPRVHRWGECHDCRRPHGFSLFEREAFEKSATKRTRLRPTQRKARLASVAYASTAEIVPNFRSVVDAEIEHGDEGHDDAEHGENQPERDDGVVPRAGFGFGAFVLADELEVAAV